MCRPSGPESRVLSLSSACWLLIPLMIEAHAVRSVRIACGSSIFRRSLFSSGRAVVSARCGRSLTEADRPDQRFPILSRRRLDTFGQCTFGVTDPRTTRAMSWELNRRNRMNCRVRGDSEGSRPAARRLTRPVSELRVTTSAASGRLTATAKCS